LKYSAQRRRWPPCQMAQYPIFA